MVVKKINRKVLDDIGEVLADYQDISVCILDEQEIKDRPKTLYAEHLQFIYSEKIYGECDFQKPSTEDIDAYLKIMKSNEIFTLRHYLTFPHDTEALIDRIYLRLKMLYISLTYLAYMETNILPRTRIETIDYFQKKNIQKLGVTLLKVLEDWSNQKVVVMKRTREYLHMLEEF